MRPKQVLVEIETLLEAKPKLSPFIHGATGIGKSQVIAQYAKQRNLELKDVRASQLDPVDARGVPVADHEEKMTRWYPPDFLPRSGQGILFLDELNRANQDTQSALYQLILERRIGDYCLPPGWSIVAAGNREIDGCFVQPMARALKNRFVHLEMEANYEDWHGWAHKNDIQEHVIAFMRFRPSALDEATEAATKDDKGKALDVLRNSNAFATPRSWEFVSNILKSAFGRGRHLRDCYSVLEGTIGEGMATEFVTYCDIYLELPDLDALIADPSLYKPTTDPNRLYAICTGLAARANANTFGNIMKVINQLAPEYSVWTVDDCLNRAGDQISSHSAYLDWVHKNIEYAA